MSQKVCNLCDGSETGKKKPEEASKVVDSNGAPKIMYRGDENPINVFDRKKAKSGLYGRGFYFTDSESHASQYGKARPYYLNVRNPLQVGQNKITRSEMRKFLEAVAKNEDYDLEYYGQGATVASVMKGLYGKGDLEMLQDVAATAIGDLVEAVELFNKINHTRYDGVITPTETVVFDSKQIKSATDNVGTFDFRNPDVRYQERDYGQRSDLELMAEAAETLSEAGGEEYWNALLESVPELAGDASGVKSRMKEIRELSRKLKETEAKLDAARADMKPTDRKLNTDGVPAVIRELMQSYGITDAKKNGIVKKATQALIEGYQQALDAVDRGKPQDTLDINYNAAVKAAEILLTEGRHTENHGGKWSNVTAERYLGEDRQQLIDDMVAAVGADFALMKTCWSASRPLPTSETCPCSFIRYVFGGESASKISPSSRSAPRRSGRTGRLRSSSRPCPRWSTIRWRTCPGRQRSAPRWQGRWRRLWTRTGAGRWSQCPAASAPSRLAG